jgi:GNAT superfamily N-acetyltransferase
MSAAGQTVKLVETKEIQMFLPVMKEIDFGDRFLLSMLHWCGIGRRSTPLDYWKVFLLRAAGEIVGVSGLYRQPEMEETVYWVGRFGIRPRFRRHGFGTGAMYALIGFADSLCCRELRVYTGLSDHVAVNFYRSLGL